MEGCIMELPCPDESRLISLSASKIIALGLNYQDHIDETGTERPEEPVLFAKTPNVLTGHETEIVIPSFLREYGFDRPEVHYEAELAVVIGSRASRVPSKDAMKHVLGYTCFNDVSQRNLQFSDISGWFRGKSLDTFGPIGPRIATREMIPNPHALRILCRLNGRVVQDSSTSEMLFSIPQIISFISKQITLEPGDVIATGTPAGVGPLAHGDLVEVEIQDIGILRNTVRDESL
jgi:2-keto-4-pentenoate hydratase/2-oxohepta-3-ene-1,7-dioic acid hydratase in catechol pathway